MLFSGSFLDLFIVLMNELGPPIYVACTDWFVSFTHLYAIYVVFIQTMYAIYAYQTITV